MAGQQRFFDPSQPQTLQIAVILLYLEAFFSLVGSFGVALPFVLAYGGGAYGIANGKKWGYILALVVALLALAVRFVGQSMTSALNDPIGLMFAIALVALLAHPQSREYQKIWFS
ncbi:MAG TPA: hypothetical protein VKX24_05860 [Acidimicrobiia bacterium]|nr:hypothetical protein [Acidimicrobiia bacterium]HZQ76121.1 hypothetical protein [Acidimicrobiia bacterium]